MSVVRLLPRQPVQGEIVDIATDKSMSHRAAILSLLCSKPSRVRGFLRAEDTLHTLQIAKNLGLGVQENDDELILTSPKALVEPACVLDCGNAGTAMRLFCGLLAGVQGSFFVLDGDCYLRARPMQRVIAPLSQMGAQIWGRKGDSLAPLAVRGGALQATSYRSPVASAQVKSAFVLAALRANGECEFVEPELSRDHTEKMLQAMGATFSCDKGILRIVPLESPLEPLDITIPSDPSSAFFFAVAAAIVPDSEIVLRNVLLNPTRIEAYQVLRKMGAQITFNKIPNAYDDVGDICVRYGGQLTAIDVSERIAWLIDEIPALAVAMACAKGKSRLTGAKELRVKETDRIAAVATNLRACGISVRELSDGFEIDGGDVQAATCDSFGDHRIAMSFAILGLLVPMTITDSGAMAVSFPTFLNLLSRFGMIEES